MREGASNSKARYLRPGWKQDEALQIQILLTRVKSFHHFHNLGRRLGFQEWEPLVRIGNQCRYLDLPAGIPEDAALVSGQHVG